MAQINLTQFAKELGLPPALLIEQLQAAGVSRALTADTSLTEKDKTQLLDYLRQSHGAKESKQKITLTRKQTTEIKKSDSTGKSRTIQVECARNACWSNAKATEPEAGRDAQSGRRRRADCDARGRGETARPSWQRARRTKSSVRPSRSAARRSRCRSAGASRGS
jgi:hypothetical protein